MIRSLKGALGLGASRLVYEGRRPAGPSRPGRTPACQRPADVVGEWHGRLARLQQHGPLPGRRDALGPPVPDDPWTMMRLITFPSRLKLGDFGGLAESIEFR